MTSPTFPIGSSISNGVVGNKGNSGNIEITTKNLSLTNGGAIGTFVQGEGNGGTVKINASDTISIDGKGTKGTPPTSISSAIEKTGKGRSGNVEITTKNLSIKNRGRITASNDGTGDGGNAIVNVTGVLSLSQGGNITARVRDNANGGNIAIDAPNGFIVAFPNQDNDIIATAEQGQGGDISINAKRVYGFDNNRIQQLSEDRQLILNNGKNDINSSSGNPKLSGTVQINTETLDPAKERIKTIEEIVEPEEVAAQVCSASTDVADANSFTITGRGGMPEDPTKPLNSVVIAGSDRAEKRGSREAEKQVAIDPKPLSSDEIIPARGAIVNEKGQVVLTRYPTSNTTERNYANAIDCNSRT